MSENWIWIDLEMTGLNPEIHTIIEIASIVTDHQLNIIAQGPAIAIRPSEEDLNSIDEWSLNQHRKSGLLKRAQDSPYNCQQAETETLNFLKKYSLKNKSPLCGNTIWQDRRFLIKYMARLESFFHYRNIDVSSVKELAKKWYPYLPVLQKQGSHLALDDIKESIRELKYYRDNIFVYKDIM